MDGSVRVEALEEPGEPPLIQVVERYRVYRGDEVIGEIEMSSRTTYGVKPRVKVRDVAGELVFDGLWEEPFGAHDEVPGAVARRVLDSGD